MDFHHFHDWVHLLLRWAHFLAGIMWIGTSLYFVWMDSAFEPLPTPQKGIDGELYMVHGGNFYYVQKRRFGAGEMPKNLHWFKWEATLTWITGFILLAWVYYLTNGAYLIDPAVSAITPIKASLVGIGVVIASWFTYDGLFRSPLAKSSWINVAGLVFIGILIYTLTHLFSGRGAFIHIGAVFGTMMVLNVWVHILPNQKAIIAASEAGVEPDYELGKKAKRHSMHNSYMTLPTLFIMLSNHFPMTYSHKYNWIILILMIAMGALLRHFMITMKKWPLITASFILGVLMFMTAKPSQSLTPVFREEKIKFSEIRAIVDNRCMQCHSAHPTDDVFTEAPNGVMYDDAQILKSLAPKIRDRVVIQKDMPLLNKTKITEDERKIIGQWINEGADINQ